jgi:hypothetical protein
MSLFFPPILVATFLGTPFVLLFMFMPALFELKRPRDAGPRLIMSNFWHILSVNSTESKSHPLFDLDDNYDMDTAIRPFVNVILSDLCNVEV